MARKIYSKSEQSPSSENTLILLLPPSSSVLEMETLPINIENNQLETHSADMDMDSPEGK